MGEMSAWYVAVAGKNTKTVLERRRTATAPSWRSTTPTSAPAVPTGATAQPQSRFQRSPSSWPSPWLLCSNRLNQSLRKYSLSFLQFEEKKKKIINRSQPDINNLQVLDFLSNAESDDEYSLTIEKKTTTKKKNRRCRIRNLALVPIITTYF